MERSDRLCAQRCLPAYLDDVQSGSNKVGKPLYIGKRKSGEASVAAVQPPLLRFIATVLVRFTVSSNL